MNWSVVRRIRQGVQVVALLLYVYLLFAALQRRVALPLADLFFRFDPLGGLSAMLASRQWLPRMALGLLTLGVTLLLGRIWCGWLCPLGTLLEWLHWPAARSRKAGISDKWRNAKYLLLIAILSAALFGSLSLLILDPITLLTRTMTTTLLPAMNHAITSIERALYALPFMRPFVGGLERLVRGKVLPVNQPLFEQNILIGLLFFALLALNALADRFWCRYLCPLGALLGLLARISFLRPIVGQACNRCGQCAVVCRSEAIDTSEGYEIMPSECIVCTNCLGACPQSAAQFQWRWRPAAARPFDPTRRQALSGLVASAAGVAVLQSGAARRTPDPMLIRPPGATNESAFLAQCIRCSQCMKVCPTSGLQPTLMEAGLEGLWTPHLVPRLGYCDYGCDACGQICPSGAIPLLPLEQKRESRMGVAAVDRNRCLPWAHGIPCIVCEEMCPRPEKAIRLEERTIVNDWGEELVVQQPYVKEDLCIGCGICEFRCPVEGQAAIQVYR